MEPNHERRHVTYPELAAILHCGYHLGLIEKRPILFPEAEKEFEKYRQKFLKLKHQEDMEAQADEITKHHFCWQKEIRDEVPFETAEKDWIEKYAAQFRVYREGPARNGFSLLELTVTNPFGYHLRPASDTSEIVRTKYCNIFVNYEQTQNKLSPQFIESLMPEEQKFIFDVMPAAFIPNISALKAISRLRPEYIETRHMFLANIIQKYKNAMGGKIPQGISMTQDVDLIVLDENNKLWKYTDLTSRAYLAGKNKDEKGSVTNNLTSLGAEPGDKLRFLISGKDKDDAAAAIKYIFEKKYERLQNGAREEDKDCLLLAD